MPEQSFKHGRILEEDQGYPIKEVARLKEPPGRLKYLTLEEINKLLASCPKPPHPLRAIITIALTTGIRKGEEWKGVYEKAVKDRPELFTRGVDAAEPFPPSRTGKNSARFVVMRTKETMAGSGPKGFTGKLPLKVTDLTV